MADLKVSALSSTSSLNSGDYLMIAQAGNSVKIDAQTLFRNIPVGPVVLEVAETPLSGAVATSTLTTELTTAVSPVAYTLAAGTQGTVKELVVGTWISGGSAVVTVTSTSGFSTLTFATINSTATLKNIDGLWYVMSVYAATVA